MSLSDQQIALIQATFVKVALDSDRTARLFYERLFELDPSTQHLFRLDMRVQGQKFMQMVATGVSGLNRLDQLAPALADLGRRHVDYGVHEAHYETVGQAFVWAIGEVLGADFTPEVHDAWAGLYKLLAQLTKGDNYG